MLSNENRSGTFQTKQSINQDQFLSGCRLKDKGHYEQCIPNAKSFDGIVFEDLNINALVWERASLSNCVFNSSAPHRTFLKAAVFIEADINKTKFVQAWMNYSSFIHSDLSDVNFKYSFLRGACFINTKLANVDFACAELDNSNFKYATLRNVSFKSAKLTKSSMVKAACVNADFSNADLYGMNLQGATFYECTFIGADLYSTNLQNANFTNPNFFPKDLALLHEPALLAILNRYQYLYLHPSRKNWRDFGLLKKLIRDDLIAKLNAVCERFGHAEATRLFDCAIQHPFFSTHRKKSKKQKQSPTKSEQCLRHAKQSLINDGSDSVPRAVDANRNYLDNLRQLNAKQLSELLSYQALNNIPCNPSSDAESTEIINALFAVEADNEVDVVQRALDSLNPLEVRGARGFTSALYMSLKARLLALNANTLPIIEYLCDVSDSSHDSPRAFINLQRTDFSNIDFKDADLRFANLSNAQLINADLSRVRLQQTNLNEAQFFPTHIGLEAMAGMLDTYAIRYIDSHNLPLLRPAICKSLIKVIKTSEILSKDTKIDLLRSALNHRLFGRHRDLLTKFANDVFSIFSRNNKIFTDSQRLIETALHEVQSQIEYGL